ncbi:MAG: hypothetical protein EOP06_11820 [Proteobacteria bacterium]|nr:MAG: hypothetical protein EOP06_11820 [Pseudomonadota bacterium]
MSTPLFLFEIDGRFHPATQQQFNKYAEHLGWFISCEQIDPRELLARIYHYRNAYEVEQVLKTPKTPGPFDDAIPMKVRSTKQMRSVIVARNKYAMQIIFAGLAARRGRVQSRLTIQKFSALELFSSPLAHEAAFRKLVGPRSPPFLQKKLLWLISRL